MPDSTDYARRVLFISSHGVVPDRDSGARRHFHLLAFLQEAGWVIHVLAADGLERATDSRRLERLGITVHDGAHEPFEDVLDDARPDLVVAAFWRNAERYLPTIRALRPDLRVIVDSVDLDFLRLARNAFGVPSRSWLGLGSEAAADYARELRAYAGSDGVLTVSEKEADLVGDLLWARDFAHVVPDFEDLEPSPVRFQDRRGMVFLGNFQHLPNVEAAVYLLTEIVPRIDKRVLDDHPLCVVGNGLPEDLRRLKSIHPGIKMVGWVPDVVPYLASSRISVVPLLHGAGTKRKLLQALALGTPTVSTSVGVESFGLTHEESVLIADEPASFAAAVERLLTDQKLWGHLRAAGLRLAAHANSRPDVHRAFMTAIDTVMARTPRQIVPIGIGLPHASPGPTNPGAEDMHILAVAQRLLPAGHTILVVSNDVELSSLLASHGWSVSSLRDGMQPSDRVPDQEGHAGWPRPDADFVIVPIRSAGVLGEDVDLQIHLTASSRAIYRDDIVLVLETVRQPLTAATESHLGHVPVKLIAFYLPQFHPIPENDLWWGPGFTEWRMVSRARPLFEGHYQPHVPADLGFYDLRLPETRRAQAEMARMYGIHGFCYYHYWFGGRVLLGRPLDEVLQSGEPDFPFCLAWANESWSRRWDGREDDVLIHQDYSPEDDQAHIQALIPALTDQRAICVDGRPMFLVWRASSLPDPKRTTDIWRDEAHRAGLPGMHLVAIETAWDLGWDATQVGFDAKVLFQPQFGWLQTTATDSGVRIGKPSMSGLEVYEYDAMRASLRDLAPVSYRRYESVFPSWDNTARKGKAAVIVHGSTPHGYEEWLREAVARACEDSANDRFVFINAWNEWAEGCHLEPDGRHGLAYLEATRRALAGVGAAAAVGVAARL